MLRAMAEVPSRTFIGRERELERLDVALRRASLGETLAVVLGGEAGVGKSRLVGAFAEQARATGCRVLIGHCLEMGDRGLPYAPFAEALRQLILEVEPGSLPTLLGPGRAELDRLLPELNVGPPSTVALDEASGRSQSRLFELFLGVLERLARTSPLVVVIEDLQWADQSTRDLLSFLIRVLHRVPVMFVATARSDEIDAGHPVLAYLAELERVDNIQRFDVRPFGRVDIARQIRAVSGEAPSDERVDAVMQRTDGNPFFVEQLVVASAEVSGQDVPPLLRDVLLARVARLSDAAQAVLRAASAAGRQVDDELLARVVDMPPRELHAALREAITHQVLVPVAGTTRHDRRYEFHHALLREVVYDQLIAGERVALHAAFAEALSNHAKDPSGRWDISVGPAELAYHWDEARDRVRALPATIEAADAAARVYAFADALRHYERALELWAMNPAGATDGLTGRAELLQRTAETAVLCGAYTRAVTLGREALEALPPDVDPAVTAWFHERLRWYLFEAGDLAGAEAALASAERLVLDGTASGARAQILAHRAGIDMFAGRYERSRIVAEAAIAAAQVAAVDPQRAMAVGILGWDMAMLGDAEAGLGLFRQALGFAEAAGGAEGTALGYSSLATLLDLLGRHEEALVVAGEGIERIRRMGLARTYGGALLATEASALFALGRWHEADAATSSGLDRQPVGRSAVSLHLQRARLDTALGHFDDASRHLDAARAGDRDLGRTEHRMGILAAAAELSAWRVTTRVPEASSRRRSRTHPTARLSRPWDGCARSACGPRRMPPSGLGHGVMRSPSRRRRRRRAGSPQPCSS